MAFYMSPWTVIVQYLTNLGIVAQGAKVYTYVAGSVNTPLATYTDSTGTTQNANPIVVGAGGRLVSPSGAPVGIWVQAGLVKHAVTDADGNLLIGPIDNIPTMTDPTAQNTVLVQLANPASSNTAGVGPVAGADLVANALKSYAVFASARAANMPSFGAGQTLIVAFEGGITIGDGKGGLFYWDATASDADDNLNVIQPTAATSLGRYRRIQFVLSGTTANRPIAVSMPVGQFYFDTTLGKPIWVKSLGPIVWVDATGAVV